METKQTKETFYIARVGTTTDWEYGTFKNGTYTPVKRVGSYQEALALAEAREKQTD
ncbi:hypothetical protein [Paraferrimonas sedimenticola]|uniref:Uncharacterized protein n=1 Tax=Paraferrimonas sedimenticola TaxID=375674 RepID=A0AA37RVI9_9GAMM|nr:hypothetical protein [Paraferrimonas sedimenticola]GLP95347.1 hypothetical protein GCM10007895_06530 [Paraferrimonas sedimenticola]